MVSCLEIDPMSKLEWYRRTTWTDVDRVDFDTRLKRSRGTGNKAQYLRIQAYHLAEVGNEEGAIQLLDRLFAEFPEKLQLAQAHEQKGSSLARLGRIEARCLPMPKARKPWLVTSRSTPWPKQRKFIRG